MEQLGPDQGQRSWRGVSDLKRQPGKDITIIGSGALVRSLLEGGLLDELRLMVHPVVLGEREAPLRGRCRSEAPGAR